jgi:hypothetical protein
MKCYSLCQISREWIVIVIERAVPSAAVYFICNNELLRANLTELNTDFYVWAMKLSFLIDLIFK